MLTVVAAVIERDGRILICQRREDQSHPLKWEFPGGKVEPGEQPAEALVRELDEELGIRAEPGVQLAKYEYGYPGKQPILLVFFSVTEFQGTPTNKVFRQICWEYPGLLPGFDFLEGDIEFVRALSARPADAR